MGVLPIHARLFHQEPFFDHPCDLTCHEAQWMGANHQYLGVPEFSAYVAAKGGQNGWTRSMARELAPFGITVNMISPGWIPVERHDKEPQEWKDAYLPTIPIGRWGIPEDLAGAVTFLASESSSFVTGQNLHVNGGLTLH